MHLTTSMDDAAAVGIHAVHPDSAHPLEDWGYEWQSPVHGGRNHLVWCETSFSVYDALAAVDAMRNTHAGGAGVRWLEGPPTHTFHSSRRFARTLMIAIGSSFEVFFSQTSNG